MNGETPALSSEKQIKDRACETLKVPVPLLTLWRRITWFVDCRNKA